MNVFYNKGGDKQKAGSTVTKTEAISSAMSPAGKKSLNQPEVAFLVWVKLVCFDWKTSWQSN